MNLSEALDKWFWLRSNGTDRMALEYALGKEPEIIDVLVDAARRLAEGERVWWCLWERDNDAEFCALVPHNGCGWKTLVAEATT